MNCRGKFKFRGLQYIDAGTFVNDKGENQQYNASYKLKLDEFTSDGIKERIFKIPTDSSLISQFQKIDLYSDVTIDFEVQQYTNSCRLVPIAIINNKN